jgi:hypothetical protein
MPHRFGKLPQSPRTYQAAKLCGTLGMSINMAGKIAESSLASLFPG